MLPAIFAIVVFWAIGGLSLGSGAEVRDLSEKGFNLLSFANSSGYSSLIPIYANASSSPESMMWLGVGIWLAIIVVIAGHAKKAKLIVNVNDFNKWVDDGSIRLFNNEGYIDDKRFKLPK